MVLNIVVIVFAVMLPSFIVGLSVTGKRCGTKVCDLLQYCSNFNKHCESCEHTCEESSHNFDLNLCADQCQDYLHETKYVKISTYEEK
ncbi:hypothetical protein Bhyg_03066, partial [Pseudolycoriella hygida]